MTDLPDPTPLTPADAAITYGPGGIRCGCGKDAHFNLTPCDGPEAWRPDTLPQWLAQRFGKTTWGELDDDTRLWWEHEAAAVRRAVARDGFKAAPPEPAPAVCRCGADPVHQMGCDAE